MDTNGWHRTGQWAAWLMALAFVIGIGGYLTWSSQSPTMQGLTPSEGAAAQFTYTNQAYGAFLTSQLAFLAAMWLYAVVGRALRQVFGPGGPRQDLLALTLLAAAVFGSGAQFLDLASSTAAHTLVPQLAREALPAVALTYAPLRSVAEWALNSMILMFGIAALITAQLVLALGKLPRWWGYATLAYGLLGLLDFAGFVAGIDPLARLGSIGIMMSTPLWALTLGIVLRGQTPNTAPVAVTA